MEASREGDDGKALRRRKWLHRLFLLGVVTKGLDGVLEVGGAVLLFVVTSGTINQWLHWVVRDELTEDPHDVIAQYLLRIGEHLSLGTKTFAAAYLAGHGVVKLILVAGLIRDRRWAYPVALVVLTAFIGYQVYRLTHIFSVELLTLTAIDVLVVTLIGLEYRARQRALLRTG